MRWHEALKIWNDHKKTVNVSHVYCLPRKGTPEHAEVKAIQDGKPLPKPKRTVGEMRKAKAKQTDYDYVMAELEKLLK